MCCCRFNNAKSVSSLTLTLAEATSLSKPTDEPTDWLGKLLAHHVEVSELTSVGQSFGFGNDEFRLVKVGRFGAAGQI